MAPLPDQIEGRLGRAAAVRRVAGGARVSDNDARGGRDDDARARRRRRLPSPSPPAKLAGGGRRWRGAWPVGRNFFCLFIGFSQSLVCMRSTPRLEKLLLATCKNAFSRVGGLLVLRYSCRRGESDSYRARRKGGRKRRWLQLADGASTCGSVTPPHIDPATSGPLRCRAPLVAHPGSLPGCAVRSPDQAHLCWTCWCCRMPTSFWT